MSPGSAVRDTVASRRWVPWRRRRRRRRRRRLLGTVQPEASDCLFPSEKETKKPKLVKNPKDDRSNLAQKFLFKGAYRKGCVRASKPMVLGSIPNNPKNFLPVF